MEPFRINLPQAPRIPVIVSVPHCGTLFPGEIINDYNADLIAAPDDTDWFVDDLYSFAPSLGITMITAVFNRWVIDLNRDPDSKPLYSDGRILTGLCPSTTFLGQPLYCDERKMVAAEEVARRRHLYFNPYHEKLQELLSQLKSEFRVVLLWDCHSIRQMVPTIRSDRFPDLILGTADGTSANKLLIDTALHCLSKRNYSLQHNDPFKGGYITRKYGQPASGQHALQLEMTKINYMDDSEKHYHPGRAKKMAELLYSTISDLSQTLFSPKDR